MERDATCIAADAQYDAGDWSGEVQQAIAAMRAAEAVEAACLASAAETDVIVWQEAESARAAIAHAEAIESAHLALTRMAS